MYGILSHISNILIRGNIWTHPRRVHNWRWCAQGNLPRGAMHKLAPMMSLSRLRLSGQLTQKFIETGLYIWRQRTNLKLLRKLFGDGGAKQLDEFFVADIFIDQQQVANIVFEPCQPLWIIFYFLLSHYNRVDRWRLELSYCLFWDTYFLFEVLFYPSSNGNCAVGEWEGAGLRGKAPFNQIYTRTDNEGDEI